MFNTLRATAILAFLVVLIPTDRVHARQRRDTIRSTGAISAEELHRQRRAWLERRRLGMIDGEVPTFGSAVVGAPRTGMATGIATGGALPFGTFGHGDPRGVLRCSAFVFGGRGGQSWWPGFDPFGALEFQGRCVPSSPWAAWQGDGWRDDARFGFLPYPAYPPVGRFYDRFHPDERGWRGGDPDPLLFGGIQEYGWGYYGPYRSYPGPMGWRDGAYGWSFAPRWSGAPSECVEVGILAANGREHVIAVALQSLGLADARDLDLAIDARLSSGRPVTLQGIDGRMLRIEPGTPIDDIRLTPCG